MQLDRAAEMERIWRFLGMRDRAEHEARERQRVAVARESSSSQARGIWVVHRKHGTEDLRTHVSNFDELRVSFAAFASAEENSGGGGGSSAALPQGSSSGGTCLLRMLEVREVHTTHTHTTVRAPSECARGGGDSSRCPQSSTARSGSIARRCRQR